MDILRITGWESRKAHDDGPEVIIEADYTELATACLKCGVIGNLYRHGTKQMTFRDTPMFGKPCIIEATVQRYKCRECGETFMPILNGIDPDRRMTIRCVDYIQTQSLRDMFTSIALHVGCTEGTIRNIAGDRIDVLSNDFEPYLPDWLGIDETMLAGEQRCVIADLETHRTIDVLRCRDKKTVTNWLYQFHKNTNLKGMSIDMWRAYLDAARDVFPGIPVVIDKFHVVRLANYGLDSVRVRIQNDKTKKTRVKWKRSKAQLLMRPNTLSEYQRFNLSMWLDNEPEIAIAYRLKETFFNLYSMPKDAGIEVFDSFADSVPASMRTDFSKLLSAIGNWRNEIVSYFDYPITNAITESLNGVAKKMNRAGSGYSFDVIRARMLQRKKAKFVIKPIVQTIWTRCQCCQGQFKEVELQFHIVPLMSPIPSEICLIICADCNKRFHTDDVIDHESLSTRFCE